jgi:ribosomal protein S18 acetylase RimI-like enzyme
VKEIIKEYQKELQEHKIQTGNAGETSEMIKKMESELAKAKKEGNEAKIKGIEKGIAGNQEKMKKGKEIPLWGKVIGDINSFDRLKNDVFASHENVIKAEKEFEECSQDKSRAAMDLMEAKRILAKAKEDLKEKFGLLEQRIEDFRNNLVFSLTPALGKDRSESLFQEIQQGLGEQFNHYDSDRSTLINLFSERSDKEKEKLDSRPMSIFVGARNPDIDLYQGNYSPCCICIDSAHMGAESTIADYNTDLGIQIVNIWDETKNEPITVAWCWIGKDENGNAALVVDNIESNTLYSANYSELLTEKLFEYLENYAKSIGVKKVVQGKANNDLPAASQLAKMDSDKGKYLKVGGYNRESGYFLEAEETGTKIIWEEKEKKKKKRKKSEKEKVEFQNCEFRSLTEEDLEDILKLEEMAYANDYLSQGEELKEDIESGKGFDYSVVLTGEKKAGKKEIIGYAVGIEDKTDEGKPTVYLEDIVISTEAQGQGFGWEIIEKMIEILKEKSAKENKTILFDMHLRESSQRLMEKHKEGLERLGLKLIDEALVLDYYDEGEDALYQVYEIRRER